MLRKKIQDLLQSVWRLLYTQKSGKALHSFDKDGQT